MCRLYAFLATEPSRVECGLVRAQNALLAQSRADSRGSPNPDGWGIAYYADGLPTVERRGVSAAGDLRFSEAASRISARAVVAHVRRASVGRESIWNTHPFIAGPWAFAHNGTITAFERVATWLREETRPPPPRGRRRPERSLAGAVTSSRSRGQSGCYSRS